MLYCLLTVTLWFMVLSPDIFFLAMILSESEVSAQFLNHRQLNKYALTFDSLSIIKISLVYHRPLDSDPDTSFLGSG